MPECPAVRIPLGAGFGERNFYRTSINRFPLKTRGNDESFYVTSVTYIPNSTIVCVSISIFFTSVLTRKYSFG